MNLLRYTAFCIIVAVCPIGSALMLNDRPLRNPTSRATALPAGTFAQWQTWSELLVLRDLRPKPFVFCALPKNGCSLWKQAMLRAGGSDHWNTTESQQIHSPKRSGLDLVGVVQGGSPGERKSRNHTDIAAVLGSSAASHYFKAVIVRDPITRMLSAYLDRCRDLGEWYRCLASGPISFEEVVSNYEHVAVKDMDVHFRPQVEMCGLQYVKYDMIGKMENFYEDSRRIMEGAGLWEAFGRSGWGPDGGSAFAEGVQLQSNHLRTHDTEEKVCRFYTVKLLARVRRLYAADFEKFGYDVGYWEQACTNATSVVSAPSQSLEVGTNQGSAGVFAFFLNTALLAVKAFAMRLLHAFGGFG